MERSEVERTLAELRLWHELNARELEGEEEEEDNYRWHTTAAQAIGELMKRSLA